MPAHHVKCKYEKQKMCVFGEYTLHRDNIYTVFMTPFDLA